MFVMYIIRSNGLWMIVFPPVVRKYVPSLLCKQNFQGRFLANGRPVIKSIFSKRKYLIFNVTVEQIYTVKFPF